MSDIIVVAPIALPLLGAIALLSLGEGKRYRRRDPLPALVAGTVFAALVLLSERGSTQTLFLPWPSIQRLGSRPAVLVDGVALVFLFSLALLAVAATMVGESLSGRKWATAILLWGGCLGVVMSANPLMLLLSWMLCKLALIAASVMARESRLLAYRLVAGGVGIAILVLLAIRAHDHPPVGLQAMLVDFSPQWVAAFFALGAIRMGLYPLHLAGFGETDAPLAPLVLGRLASAVAGLYLWVRAFMTIRSLPSQLEYLVVLGGAVALISAFAAWGARSKRAVFPWLVGFELGVISVALGFAAPKLSILAVLETFNLLLAGGVFGLSLHAMDRLEGRWARGWVRGLGFLALASLLGLPPTPGFVARWGLYRHAMEVGNVAAILPIVAASGLLVPALLAAIHVRNGQPVRRLNNRVVVGLTVLGLPLVLTSAQPLLLTPFLDIMTDVRSYAIMVPLIRGASTSLSAKVIALILIPVLAGYSLDRVHDLWRAQGRLAPLWQFLSLEWLYDVLASTVLRAAIAVSILLTFLELGSMLGLAVVAGLLLMLVVLRR